VILVTGANGFIGSHVVERLLRDGRKVRGLVRASSDLTFLEGVDVELARGDITNRASLDAPMRGVEVAVHVAGFVSDWDPRAECRSVNVHGTRNVIEAARAAGVRRLVHISTAALHGFPGARTQDESSPMPETSFAYCESKKQAERDVFASGLEATAIRPGNVFGPRDHTFIDKYAQALEQGKCGYVGGGRSWTCPAYVENLADAIALACFEPAAAGEAFLVTDGLDIDWRTFTENLADELGVKRPRLSIPFWLAYPLAAVMEGAYQVVGAANSPPLTRYRVCNGGRDYHFSIAKARRVLKYKPKVGLEEALRRTVRWYRERCKPNRLGRS
jgi:nucleoside-diphosphate-sugar epimerase